MPSKSILERLEETAVKCSSLDEYKEVLELYHKAGVPIWPWHKGYKKPEDDIHECPFYGYEPAGFMKHIMPVPQHQQLTIEELRTIVNQG